MAKDKKPSKESTDLFSKIIKASVKEKEVGKTNQTKIKTKDA